MAGAAGLPRGGRGAGGCLKPGQGQAASAGHGAAAEAATVPKEILITARKREETLTDVPLSVAAFSSDQLIAKGLTSDYDVATFTVGFRTLPQTGRDIDRPIIRGMAGPNTRGEPNASYFIDGVFVSGSISVDFDLTEDVTLTVEGRAPGGEKTARGGSLSTSGIRADATTAAFEGCTPPADPGQPLLVSPCLPEPLGIVPEEEQWTYELGAKSMLFDGRVSANLAVYYIDWDNQGLFTLANILQNTGTYLTTTIIRPVGKSEVRGLELETAWRVTDKLTLVANYGYTDSRYVEGQDSVLEETTGNGDLKDHSVPGVPRNTLVLGGNLVVPLEPGLDAFVNADYVYNSRRYSSATNLAWIGAEELLNLRVGARGRRWTATAYVRNLTNDATPLAALDFINFGLTDVNYPLNAYGNLLNDRDPRLFSLNPKRGRDYGLELQLRF